MTGETRWLVTVSPDRLLSDVARQLPGTGFAVVQVLDEIGCIIGKGGAEAADKVRGLPGVVDVSPDSPVDIGSPDAPTTR